MLGQKHGAERSQSREKQEFRYACRSVLRVTRSCSRLPFETGKINYTIYIECCAARSSLLPLLYCPPPPATAKSALHAVRCVANSRSLALDVAKIGVTALESEGRALEPEEYRLKVTSDVMIPPHCRRSSSEWRLPRLKFNVRVAMGDAMSSQDVSVRASNILTNYQNAVSTATGCGVPQGMSTQQALANPSTLGNCLVQNEQSAYRSVNQYIAHPAGSPLGSAWLSKLNATDRNLLQAYVEILNSSNPMATLGTYRGKLSTEDKLTLVQTFGGQFLADYNSQRANGVGSAGQGAVSANAIFAAAQYNSAHFSQTNVNSLNSNAQQLGIPVQTVPNDPLQYAGICRDIASAEAQMLQTLGMKRTYTVSMAVAESGEYHTQLITQDPDHPQKVYVVNYGDRLNHLGGDSRALFQGLMDGSINYRLYNPGGRMAKDVQSDFGKFMAEAAGFDIRTIDPLAHAHGSLVSAQYEIAPQNQLQVGAGTDGLRNYLVVGGNHTYLENTLTPGSVGLVLATQNTPSQASGLPIGSNLDLLYIHLEQRFNTPWHHLNPSVQGASHPSRRSSHHRPLPRGGRGHRSGRRALAGSSARGPAGLLGTHERYLSRRRANRSRHHGRSQCASGGHSGAQSALLYGRRAPRAFKNARRPRVSDCGHDGAGRPAGPARTGRGGHRWRQGRRHSGGRGALDGYTANYQDGTGRKAVANIVWTPANLIRL